MRLNDTKTIECATGYRAAAVGSSLATINDPKSFQVRCESDCSYSGMKQCAALPCGTYSGLGFQYDAEWSAGRVYFQGESITVSCPMGYVVKGSKCQKSFVVGCADGQFEGQQSCVQVSCVNGSNSSCGEGFCPSFYQTFSDEFDQVLIEAGTGSNSLQKLANDVVPHGQQVLVKCIATHAPTPIQKYPQDWSDCPYIPGYAPGTFPASCNDCSWNRPWYCSMIRCDLHGLLGSKMIFYMAKDPASSSVDYIYYGQSAFGKCLTGYTFSQQNYTEYVQYTCGYNCTVNPFKPCIPKECGKVPPQLHASVDSNAVDKVLVEGDKVTIVCMSGYRVNGTTCDSYYTLSCVNGIFLGTSESSQSPRIMACEAFDGDGSQCNACPPIKNQKDFLHISSWSSDLQIRVNQSILVQCEQGYRSVLAELQNFPVLCNESQQHEISCTQYGWQSRYVCRKISCPVSSSSFQFSTIEPTGHVLFNQSANLTCNMGYRPGTSDPSESRLQILRCTENCDLTQAQTCQRAVCESFDLPKYAVALEKIDQNVLVNFNPDAYKFQLYHDQSILFNCQNSFYLPNTCNSSFRISCYDGVLSGFQDCFRYQDGTCTTCKGVTVANISNARAISYPHAISSTGMFDNGEFVHVTCMDGYFASSSAQFDVTCENGVSGYNLVCSNGTFVSNVSCNAATCVPYLQYSLDNNVLSVVPSIVKYQEYVNVTCKYGYRPSSTLPSSQTWFSTPCLSNC
eukprot:713382-Hanusia_phi.AAC.6